MSSLAIISAIAIFAAMISGYLVMAIAIAASMFGGVLVLTRQALILFDETDLRQSSHQAEQNIVEQNLLAAASPRTELVLAQRKDLVIKEVAEVLHPLKKAV